MKLENINITTNLLKGISFIGAVIFFVWKASALTLGVQQSIDSRFERLENKIEMVDVKQTNQYKMQKNDRKRDSALFSNGFKDLKTEIKETQSLLIRRNFSNGTVSNN